MGEGTNEEVGKTKDRKIKGRRNNRRKTKVDKSGKEDESIAQNAKIQKEGKLQKEREGDTYK